MKIAITGGAGFIGSHITRAYLDAGHDALVIDTLANSDQAAIDARARFYRMDIRDGKLQELLRQERPDIVSHHAAQCVPHEMLLDEQSLYDADIHVRGLLNVLESCVAASVRKIIFASGGNSMYGCLKSTHTFEDAGPTLLREDAPLCPQRPHDISKVAGEWYVRYYSQKYGLAHTILRYADVYGETDSRFAHHPLSYLIEMLSAGRRPLLRGSTDDVRDHIFIDDVMRANLCALERGRNQTFHISSAQGYTIKQFYSEVAYLLGSAIEPTSISSSFVEPSSTILDNSLARQTLGWSPQIDFVEGVRLAVERLQNRQPNLDTQLIVPALVGVR
jgi:UDP-glucose 4-epimerase